MGDVRALPSGKSITLRPPEDVSERLRRPISRAVMRVRPEVEELRQPIPVLQERLEALPADSPEREAATKELERAARAFAAMATDEEMDAYSTQNDLAAVALVARWDYPDPVSLDAILDLPHRDYDALREIVAPLVNQLFVDTSPDPNPPAPTGGSNGSATPSLEVLQTTSPMSSETTA